MGLLSLLRVPSHSNGPSSHGTRDGQRGSVATQKTPARRAKASSEPILRTKLTRPNLAAGILARPRLQEALATHADRPLSLVVADAGYGKTTLLASFSASLGRPVVWYSLMPS